MIDPSAVPTIQLSPPDAQESFVSPPRGAAVKRERKRVVAEALSHPVNELLPQDTTEDQGLTEDVTEANVVELDPIPILQGDSKHKSMYF